jgi:hypothetical protein
MAIDTTEGRGLRLNRSTCVDERHRSSRAAAATHGGVIWFQLLPGGGCSWGWWAAKGDPSGVVLGWCVLVPVWVGGIAGTRTDHQRGGNRG